MNDGHDRLAEASPNAVIALPLILLGLAWLQELLDQLLFSGRWNLAMGPGTPWWTLFTAPFSHAGLGHLVANSLVFLPLSYLVLARAPALISRFGSQ